MVPFPLGAVNGTDAVVVETVTVPIVGASGFVKIDKAGLEDADDLNIPFAIRVKLYDVLDVSPLIV